MFAELSIYGVIKQIFKMVSVKHSDRRQYVFASSGLSHLNCNVIIEFVILHFTFEATYGESKIE